MPRKKQLKVSGNSITSFSVQVKQVKSDHGDVLIDIVDLQISTIDGVYKYDIRKDVRAPDIYATRDYIENSLEKAKKEFLKVEISEYTERMYLFFDVKSIGRVQYTGYRV
ncbi:hypothetical protein SAMN02745753_02206 [Marinomonas polaris DSM 16579]|uniref:Uncharacterized protein n=1 Tax=Marinomonas polaris DSM 16579 TaxID=1122206 RepID=A0A1M5CPQ1_9GAMM|nr:hypothetical protein [Marinomonas polaris]SHF56676.1 hypothetical protein SAMN02745753_02206 [Marinomonas polaris DSM 16579]